MTEQEYYYNVELLELLEKMIEATPGLSLNEDYFMSYIDSLKERLHNLMFDEERKEKDE